MFGRISWEAVWSWEFDCGSLWEFLIACSISLHVIGLFNCNGAVQPQSQVWLPRKVPPLWLLALHAQWLMGAFKAWAATESASMVQPQAQVWPWKVPPLCPWCSVYCVHSDDLLEGSCLHSYRLDACSAVVAKVHSPWVVSNWLCTLWAAVSCMCSLTDTTGSGYGLGSHLDQIWNWCVCPKPVHHVSVNVRKKCKQWCLPDLQSWANYSHSPVNWWV